VKEQVWIDERDALALHDRLLALLGGAVGLRDNGLLKSALARPQQHFDGAERLARRTRSSRSRLFTDALREYLARHAPDKVTESMDQAIMEVGEGKDEFVSSVARRRLERGELRSPVFIVLHVKTHTFHHKVQIVAMLRILGYPAPDTDLQEV
jgi:hypothetical protein